MHVRGGDRKGGGRGLLNNVIKHILCKYDNYHVQDFVDFKNG